MLLMCGCHSAFAFSCCSSRFEVLLLLLPSLVVRHAIAQRSLHEELVRMVHRMSGASDSRGEGKSGTGCLPRFLVERRTDGSQSGTQ